MGYLTFSTVRAVSDCTIKEVAKFFDDKGSVTMSCLAGYSSSDDRTDTIGMYSESNVDSYTINTDIICTTVESPQSSSNINAVTYATCPSGYTMIGCTAQSLFRSVEAAYIDHDSKRCYGKNGENSNYVTSTARCCKGLHISKCSTYWSALSGTGDDNQASVSCKNDNQVLTSCGFGSLYHHIDGVYAGYQRQVTSQVSTSNTCTVQNGKDGRGG